MVKVVDNKLIDTIGGDSPDVSKELAACGSGSLSPCSSYVSFFRDIVVVKVVDDTLVGTIAGDSTENLFVFDVSKIIAAFRKWFSYDMF